MTAESLPTQSSRIMWQGENVPNKLNDVAKEISRNNIQNAT